MNLDNWETAAFDGILVDVDGVLLRGATPITQNLRALCSGPWHSDRLRLVTNNSSRSHTELRELLFDTGLDLREEQILSPATALTLFVSDVMERIYVCGSDALKEQIANAGFTTFSGLMYLRMRSSSELLVQLLCERLIRVFVFLKRGLYGSSPVWT